MRDYATGRPESRYLFFENKLGPYHTLIKLLTDQGKNFEALLYAERAKGRLLLEAVRSNTADLQNMLTPAEKVEIERLHDKVLATHQRLQSATGDEATGELKNQLDAAKREFASFEKTLVAAHPELLLRAGPPQRKPPYSECSTLSHAELLPLIGQSASGLWFRPVGMSL